MTTLTHEQIAHAVQVVDAAIAKSGTDYVNQHYPFFLGLATPIIKQLSHQAAIAVINDLVLNKVLP